MAGGQATGDKTAGDKTAGDKGRFSGDKGTVLLSPPEGGDRRTVPLSPLCPPFSLSTFCTLFLY